jgi:Major capsid protein Gp23.
MNKLTVKIKEALFGFVTKRPKLFHKLTKLNEYFQELLRKCEVDATNTEINAFIAALPAGDTGKYARQLRTIMDNVINEAYSWDVSGNRLSRNKYIMLNLRVALGVMKNLSGIVGIQPINKSSGVGSAFFMLYKESDAKPVVTKVDDLRDKIEGRTRPDGTKTYIEGFGGKKMTLEVVSTIVQATHRKLSAVMTIDAMTDMKQVGVDFENEFMKALESEIVHEIVIEVLNDLKSINEIDLIDSALTTFSYYGDDSALSSNVGNLVVLINQHANDIARTTRRGSGNFAVVTPIILSMLQTSKAFVPDAVESFTFYEPVQRVGVLCGTIVVYVSLHVDGVLLGYNGGGSTVDAGYVLSPFIPVRPSGLMTNPVTYQPQVNFLTRMGKVLMPDYGSEVSHYVNYYRYLKLEKRPELPSIDPDLDHA